MTQESGDGAPGGTASVESAGDGAFDALAAAVEEGAFRLDVEGRFEAANDALGDLVGYDREELIGERFTTLVGEEDAGTVEAAIRELRGDDGGVGDEGRVVDVEVSIRTAPGEPVPGELRLAAVGSDGRFVGTAGSLRVDGRRRREVEALERERDALESELDEALERITDAFFVLDDEWRFTYMNGRAEALLDVDRESVVGRSVWEEFEEAVDSTFYEEYHESMERQEPTSFVEYYPPLSTWFEVVAYPGETGLSVYFRDVTERVRRERELEHHETLVQTVDDGLYAVDEEYRFTLVNDAYCALTGYDREELIGEHISLIVDESTVEESMALRERMLEEDGEPGSVEVEIERADGERVTVESSYAVMPGDEFRGTVGVVRDVSERKAFEESLAALHEASRELHDAETIDDVGRIVLETVTDVLDLSAATLFRYDQDADEMVPEHRTDGAEATGQELPTLPAGEESLTGHVFELGEVRTYDDIRGTPYVDEPKTDMRAGLFAPVGDDRLLVVSATEPGAFDVRVERLVDILAGNATAALERQERQRELRESERRYRMLVDNFPDGAVALYDEECHYVAVGGQMYDRIDLSPEDAVGMTVGERLSGEIAGALESLIQRAFEGESEEVEVPYDGRDFRLQSLPIRDDDGDVALAMVVTQDVTERKRAEEALEESEERYRTLVDNFPNGSVGLFDSDLRYLIVGGEIYDEIELSVEDVVGMSIEKRLPAGLWEELEAPIRATFDGESNATEVRAEGRDFWVQTLPVRDEEGDVIAGMIMSQDVTERKEYERELEQYERIVETVDDGVYVLDGEGRFVFVNGAFTELTGYDREELIGADVSTVTTGEYGDVIEEEVRRLEAGEVSVGNVETAVRTAEGERIPVEARFSLFELEEGGHGRVGVVRDATERKEREQELERYETAVDTASDVIVTIDEESTIKDVNPAVAGVFGYDPDELVGESLTKLMPERMRQRHREGLERYLETGETRLGWDYVELPGEHRDGHEIPLSVSFGDFEYDGEHFFAGIIRDVTERKRAQQQLEEERDMFAEGPAVVFRWEIGEGWPVEYVSENVEEVLGYTPAEFESGDVRFTDLLLDEEIDRITREIVENSDETTERFSHEPYRIQTKDGDVRWVKDVTKILRDESGDITGYLGYLVDITERKKRERELAEERERYRGLVESAPIAIGTYDADGRITFVNDATVDLLGADDPGDLVGEPAIEFVHPDDREETVERVGRVIEGRELAPPEETRLVGVDGEVRYAMVASAPITREGEPGGQVVMSDVSDRKEYERALEASEQRYRTLVENYPDGAVALFDEDLCYTAVGGQLLETEDVDPEKRIGRSISELYPEDLIEEVEPHFRAALEGEMNSFEVRFRGRDLFSYTLPVTDADGGVIAGMLVVNDVTAQREYERTLERFQTIIETVDDGVYIIDSEGYITMVNAAYARMTGYDREELVGMHASALVDETVHERARDIEEELARGEASTARLAAELETADDRSVTAEATFALLPGDDEEYERVAVVRDVTERVERERELERALDLLHQTEDVADVGGWELDAGTMEVYWTEQLFDILGVPYDEEPPLNEALEAVYHPEDRAIVEEAIEHALESGEPFDVEARFVSRDDDEPRWARIQGVPAIEDGEVVSLRGAFQDITERIEREQELQRTLDLLERTENIADVGGWEIDPETQDVFWTEHTYELQGIPPGEEPPIEEALDVYHPEDRTVVEEALEHALESGEPIDVEVRYTPVGSDEVRWFRLQGVPAVEDGEVVSLRGAAQDVTERVERERELKQFEVLFEESTDVNAVIEPDGTFRHLTPSVTNVLGYGQDELVGENAFEYIHPDDRELAMEEFAELIDDQEHMPAVEIRFQHEDGSWVDLDARASNLLDEPDIEGVVAYTRDISELKARERELRQQVEEQQAVTELGTLALEEPDLDRLFDRATALVARTLDNDLCKLLELQPDGDGLALRAGRGWDDGLVGEATLGTEDDSIAGRTLETEEAIVVDDIQAEDPDHRPELLTAHGGRSGVSVIVGTPQDPWGVLGTYDTERREFSQQDVNFVQSVANILGIAIERASREEELHTRVEQQQVVTDLGKQALEDVDLDRLFDEAVERVAETLDNEYAKVLELLPDGESLLLRSGVGWQDGLVGEGTVGTGDDSQAGHTIRSEEPIVVTDLQSEERFSGPELLTSHGVVSGISTIIGPYDDPWGVLGTHDTERREFSQQDVNFVQSVANILATAIDRRTREREIESQRNRMAAIVRLSEIVQEVDQAVIEQSTREEIDRLVCTHLVESGEYGAAWVGDVNLASQTVAPRAVAGVPDGTIDAVSFDSDGDRDDDGEYGYGSPTAAAAATGEAWTGRAGDDEEAFPAVARERGYRSMAAVPLAFEDVRYGVLTLFSERENAFEGYERAVLEQLGRTVGHAINAIDRKQALVGDSFTEIEIRLPGVVESLDVGEAGEHSIDVEGTVPASGDRIIQYVTVTGIDPETFLELAEVLPGVGEVRQIGGDGPSYRYEVIHDDPPITSTLASYGGRIGAVSFDVPDLCVTAALPPSADIRQIVQTLRTEYPDLRIDAQRTVSREQTSAEEHRNTIEEALTERQRTALMTAFFAGYFEWSRESTGEEVAETLGVSPSTFHQHLRAAQRKVLSALFEGETAV